MYNIGTKLISKSDNKEEFFVVSSDEKFTKYSSIFGDSGTCQTKFIEEVFIVHAESVLTIQKGGDHYKKLGAYQPWEVLKAWLTPEEFRGYMKGTAIAYLARERDKGGLLDIEKATHTLQGLIELQKGEE